MVSTRKIMVAIVGSSLLFVATMAQPALKASAQQDSKKTLTYYLTGQAGSSSQVVPTTRHNKLAPSEMGEQRVSSVGGDIPSVIHRSMVPQVGRESEGSVSSKVAVRRIIPIPNAYRGDNCVPIPNAYRGDNCVPIPNVMKLESKDSSSAVIPQLSKPLDKK